MAGDPPPNLLNAEQVRELLSRIPSRITNPQGDERNDVRPINTTQGRWGFRSGIWTRDEREALEATYKHITGQDIDLTQLHRSEYEHLAGVMQSVADVRQSGTAAPGAIVSSEGPRNFDLDKAIVDRVIEHLSISRSYRTSMPQDDVANIRALYVAYDMEEQIYGRPTTTLEGTPISGAVTAPEGEYTDRELNRLGELRRQILHARTRGYVTRPDENDRPDTSADTAENEAERQTETQTDNTVDADDSGVTVYPVSPQDEIEVTELPPLETGEEQAADESTTNGPDEGIEDGTSSQTVDETIEETFEDTSADTPDDATTEVTTPQGRMTIVGEGEGWEPHNADVVRLQTALVIAGFDVGTFPDHMAKAGEPLIDGYEGPLTRAAVMQAVTDLKELGIEVDPRTTALNDFVAQLEDPSTEVRLKALHELRSERTSTPEDNVDYQEKAREQALSGDGLTSKTDFDQASANTTDIQPEPQPKVEFDMSVPTEESLTPR